MKQSYIFAFGSNVHNKTVPFDPKLSVFSPVNVLPELAKVIPGDEAASGSWEVVWSGWAETLVRSHLQDQYIHYGFTADSGATPRLFNLPNGHRVKKWLGHDSLSGYLADSGEICSLLPKEEEVVLKSAVQYDDAVILATDEMYALTSIPGRFIDVFASFQDAVPAGNAKRRIHLELPLIPPTISPRISLQAGLSHVLVHCASPFNTVMGLGDNRHSAAVPYHVDSSSEDSKYQHRPGHTISHPTDIKFFEGVEVKQVICGGSRSGAVSPAGEAWIWGNGIQGIEPVHLAETCKEGYDAHSEVLEDGTDVKLLAIGEGYDVAVTESDQIWVRGKNDFGQLGLASDIASVSSFQPHPFFAGNYRIKSVLCSRWSTFITCEDL